MKFLLIAGLAESVLNFRGALVEALRSRGIEVHVAIPGLPGSAGANPCRPALEAAGLVVHEIAMQRTGTSLVADLRMLRQLRATMARVKPDFVLGYTVKPVVYGLLAAWLARVPHRFALITGLGYAFQGGAERRTLQSIAQFLYALALKRAEVVFFQNDDDRQLFMARRIVPAHVRTCVVNGSGVKLEDFRIAPLPDGPPVFLLIARLLGDKGVREYVEAARAVRARSPGTRLQIVGWIDSNPDAVTREELDGWVAEGCVEYLGRLSDVRPAIAASSVYVLPSYREGTPRTVLEAMAMGRPIITTDAPGCRQTVVEGDNGFLVPVKSAAALAQAMCRFIDEPGLVARMGARSRVLAEDKYDVHKVNGVMLGEMGIR
jgi:glycosyltransferase involved in cell wall biosynthesis